MKNIIYILIFLSVSFTNAQDIAINSSTLLEELSEKYPALNDKMRIDISGLSLYDFLNAVAVEHEINISADADLNTTVQSSFFNIPVKDVFSFAVQKYNLELSVINDIIIFNKKIEKIAAPTPILEKEIDVTYNDRNKFLSVKLTNDDLFKVTQKITDLSGRNFVIDPEVRNQEISAYIVNRPIDQVIEMISRSNALDLEIDEDNFFNIKKRIKNTSEQISNTRSSRNNPSRRVGGSTLSTVATRSNISVNDRGFLSVDVVNAPAYPIILEAAEKLNVNYVVFNEPTELSSTFKASQITFDEFLEQTFKDSDFTYTVSNGLYTIGLQTARGLREKRLIQLENRTIETVLETLPQELLKGIDVKEFIELNGFMVSGSKPRIDELEDYISQIDQVVPMILIEVIIAQYQKSHQLQTGIKAGLGAEARGAATGVLFPDADVSMGSSTINKLIEAFNGLGIFNLGKVTERFYLDLKYLENNSVINLQSTPKIATLNGHDARLSIGETSYYFEQNNRLINSGIGNDILQSGVWKPTEANLSLNIVPFVSKDEQITLTIGVERSSFLGRQGENAPPGKATQQFESLIRCKNGEMILLGGLDELERENSGTGTPFLSRIPILKWFFSGRNKRKEKSKLHIFIKPTIVY